MGYITAHVQSCKAHMCSMTDGPRTKYPYIVKNDEKPNQSKGAAKIVVARWRDALLQQKFKNSAKAWADASGVSGTTITRNMGLEHPSTAKLENLHVLARAAGVPSVLDFLEQQTVGEVLPLPNSTVLTATFAMLLDSIDVDPNQDGRAQKLARSFPDALKQMITLHEGTRHQIETYPEADAHVRDEDQPEA